MKNTTTTSIERVLLKWLIVAGLLMAFNCAFSQSVVKTGLSLAISGTGNGFGSTINPGIFIKKNRNQFEVVIDIQRKPNISGGQFTYEFCFFDGTRDMEEDEAPLPCEVFVFSNVRYSANAMLSPRQMEVERHIAGDRSEDFTALRFSAIDAHIGFGIKVNLNNRVKWVSSIGMGACATLSGRKDIYREYYSQSILLKTGLCFDLNHKYSKSKGKYITD